MRYTPDRKTLPPAAHFAGFANVLQADGSAGFERLRETGRITEAACRAHVRRTFHVIAPATASPIAAEAIHKRDTVTRAGYVWDTSQWRITDSGTNRDTPFRGVPCPARLWLMTKENVRPVGGFRGA